MSQDPELLYEQARAKSPSERVSFIENACRDDPELRAELLSLLVSSDAAEGFFERLGARMSATLPTPPFSEPNIDDTIRHYRILSRIGSGGMGTVYHALDTRLNREVALKFLPAYLGADQQAQRRLLAEARAAAALDHPNVCSVFEVADGSDGQLFIAMALCHGETLKERLSRGPLSLTEAIEIATQIARGLTAAHAHGVVHRDVKPGNVIVGVDGTVKLLDFGVAVVADATRTRAAATAGTVAYMSPEHVRGEEVDQRTDLWSLGVVLYEMLTGKQPFRGGTDRALVQSILHDEPQSVVELRPEIPVPVARIVERLLQKDRNARYSGANEVVVELTRSPMQSKASAAQNEERRVAALRSYGILDTPAEATFDNLIRLAARLCNAPAGYIKFFDEKRAWFKAKLGLPEELNEMPREDTVCNITLKQSDLVAVPDCSVDERFRDHPRVTGWPYTRFYCSMPIIDTDGYALGTFCVFDYEPHEITVDQQNAIRTLANEALTHVQLHRTTIRLNQSQVDLASARQEVDRERAKAHGLLCQILPRPIAEEFAATGHVQPRYHEFATVLIADFRGFSRLAASTEPGRLVQTLNEFFSVFDGIVERHGLEKIKTVGDWYLCVAGVPVANRSDAVDACLAALEMQGYSAAVNRDRVRAHLEPWALCIGIHAGPTTSGMVGRAKFTYDLWGDVVKIAHRIEASAQPGQTIISQPVLEAVRHCFESEQHGTLDVRNRDSVPTYTLTRILPELAADPEGRLANAKFAVDRYLGR